MTCESCRHQDTTTYLVPICTKAAKPNACVLAFERAQRDGKCRHYKAK